MKKIELELFEYNRWANRKLLDACMRLSESQLDTVRPMGLETIRNTWFHVLDAEKLWLERWRGDLWRPLNTDPASITLGEIRRQLDELHDQRIQFCSGHVDSGFRKKISFKDSQQQPWELELGDMMNHVSNHGIHHRAQILNFMRHENIRIKGGVDYLFYKLAFPSANQSEEAIHHGRSHGIDFALEYCSVVEFDLYRLSRYQDYGDWAMNQVFKLASSLDDRQLGQPFQMGCNSLHETIQHIIDSELWWADNWANQNSSFPDDAQPRPFQKLVEEYREVVNARRQFTQGLNEQSAQRIVRSKTSGPDFSYRVIESLLQLCGHGTHHRAQCLNMIRQLGGETRDIDLFFWLVE